MTPARRLKLAVVGGARSFPIMLRTYCGQPWTVATNGHAIVGIRGKYTRRISGPSGVLRSLGMFNEGAEVSLSGLKRFLDRPGKLVEIGGVKVNRLLVKRALRVFGGKAVRVSASAQRVYSQPVALYIENGDAVAVCMAVAGAKAGAKFKERKA